MKFKTVKIKGKDYVTVNERIKYFRTCESYKGYSLDSEIISISEKSVTIKASIRDDKGVLVASGFANEEKSGSYINKTSYIENCETSAWGRALANIGIGIDTSIASSEEVSRAVSNQNNAGSDQNNKEVIKYLVADAEDVSAKNAKEELEKLGFKFNNEKSLFYVQIPSTSKYYNFKDREVAGVMCLVLTESDILKL